MEVIYPKCHTSNPARFKFCGECGYKMDTPSVSLQEVLEIEGERKNGFSTAVRFFYSALEANLATYGRFEEAKVTNEKSMELKKFKQRWGEIMQNFFEILKSILVTD